MMVWSEEWVWLWCGWVGSVCKWGWFSSEVNGLVFKRNCIILSHVSLLVLKCMLTILNIKSCASLFQKESASVVSRRNYIYEL